MLHYCHIVSLALLHMLKSLGGTLPCLNDTVDTKAKNYMWPVIEMS